MAENKRFTARLSDRARFLRNAAPEEFTEFVREFGVHASSLTVAVTEAAPEEILIKQGHAQHALSLLRVFAECDL